MATSFAPGPVFIPPLPHTVITREEITGVEFDWFGVDVAGHLAQFLAAGDNVVPAGALQSEEYLEALHVCIDALPASEPVNAPAGGLDLHLARAQQRGVFVYDALLGQPGHYRLVAAPVQPLTPQQLPAELQPYLASLRLEVKFGAQTLNVQPDGAVSTTR